MGIKNMMAETSIELSDDLIRWQMAFKGVLYFCWKIREEFVIVV